MSLTEFIKRPRIGKAFDEFALKERTPPAFKKHRCLVPDHRGPSGLSGVAFDYLARMKVLRHFQHIDIQVHQRKWLSETIREWCDEDYPYHVPHLDLDGQFWASYLDRAHKAAKEYITQSGCLSCLALKVQYMAHADLLQRNPDAFELTFQPSTGVAHELQELLELFDPASLFEPKNSIVLNPAFPAAQHIGGADGDLIVDNRLIDLKTTKRLQVTKSHLLQLAGYKVLSDIGGIEPNDDHNPVYIDSVGIYFARHRQLYEISVDELFPENAYEEFRAIFEKELRTVENAALERKRELDEFFARTRKRKEGRAVRK